MADCSNSGLINIPNSLPKHTDWLILSGNNLTSLNVSSKQTVEILEYLSKLDLHSNKIENVSSKFLDFLQKTAIFCVWTFLKMN